MVHNGSSELEPQSYRIHWQPLISEGQAPGDLIASRATQIPGQVNRLRMSRILEAFCTASNPPEPCLAAARIVQRGCCTTLPPNLMMLMKGDAGWEALMQPTNAPATSVHDLRTKRTLSVRCVPGDGLQVATITVHRLLNVEERMQRRCGILPAHSPCDCGCREATISCRWPCSPALFSSLPPSWSPWVHCGPSSWSFFLGVLSRVPK